MNESRSSVISDDAAQLRLLFEQWAKAVRQEDREGIYRDHEADILLFDVPPPLLSRGLSAYASSWDLFFSSAEKPVAFDFEDVELTCGTEVAFLTAVGRCVSTDSQGQREPLQFRLTMGFRKREGRWRIAHEHHSLPA